MLGLLGNTAVNVTVTRRACARKGAEGRDYMERDIEGKRKEKKEGRRGLHMDTHIKYLLRKGAI